jgi:glycosyltransferase involved in cell wall biosynthesis
LGCEFDIEKAFMGRIFALHKYGGLMISDTMRIIKNLDNFLKVIKDPSDCYIKSSNPNVILFEHFPLDFERFEKISNHAMLSLPNSKFLSFCIQEMRDSRLINLDPLERVKLSLKNIDEQSEIINLKYGQKFIYNCAKKYIFSTNNNDLSVLPYYFINPCSCQNLLTEEVLILNGKIKPEAEPAISRDWTQLNEHLLVSEKLANSFMYDTDPKRDVDFFLKTKVAMFVWQFPSRANTFVMNEVMEMHRRGVDLTIYSMSMPTAECNIIYKEELKEIKHKIVNIPYSKLLCHQQLMEDKIAFFQNDFRLALELCKTVDPTLEHYNQQEQECVQNSEKFLEKLIEDLTKRGIEKIYAPFANADAEIAMMVSYHTGIPYYFTAHAYDLFSSYYYQRMKAKSASHVFVISEYNKKYMIEELGMPEEKITVRRINFLAPNPQDIVKKDLGVPYIFGAGRFHEMKGFEYSIRAFYEFHKKHPEIHYVIVGCGELEYEIKTLIQDLSLDDFVHLMGHVKNREVLEFQKGALFSILSSIELENRDKEGLPTFFVESMSLGTPCIGTNYSGTPELIDHGINGMLTKEKDVEDITSKMLDLYEKIKLDSNGEIGQSCRNKIAAMFDNEKNIHLLLEHIK